MTVMPSNTDYLPDEITYGFVADRVLLAVGDTNRDLDRFPDGVAAQGTVKFSPERTILYTQQTPATVLPQDIECTIYHRDHPVAKEHGYEPELVGKLVDPAGHVGNVALIVGWYEAVYRLETGTAQRFRFKVLPEHTNENPLWLPSVAPLTPTPSERFVVNEQVYNETIAARDEVLEAYDTVLLPVQVQDTPPESTDVIWVNPNEPAGTASEYALRAEAAATDVLEAAENFGEIGGITVDTSVGTRVFVGDTMIHGDTGWRDVSDLLPPWWEVRGVAQHRFHIKRVGNDVHLLGRVSYVDNGENNPYQNRIALLENFPSGFRPSWIYLSVNLALFYSGSQASTPAGQGEVFFAGSTLYVVLNSQSGGWENDNGLGFSLKWNTNNPWPASLPGVPA